MPVDKSEMHRLHVDLKSGVTHWLLRRRVVIIQISAEKGKPFSQLQNPLVVEIRRAAFDYQDLLRGKVLGETGCKDTASRATAAKNITSARVDQMRATVEAYPTIM